MTKIRGSKTTAIGALGSFGLVLWLGGSTACDPRAPEPSVTRERMPESATPANATNFARPPKRCMKETPDVPDRLLRGPVPNPDCPDDPGPVPTLEHRKVEIAVPEGDTKVVDAEVASQDADRQRGLMYRKSLGEDEGMLFVFESERSLTFWMHNTCIPLDMLFIARDGMIVGIEENTPTLSDDTFSAGCPGLYVLEVNAGWARKNGVKAGMKIKLK